MPTGSEAVKAASQAALHNPAVGSTASVLPFVHHRQAALALLNSPVRLTRTAGSFLGQLAVDTTPITAKQADWLAKLLARANLPPLVGGRYDRRA